MAIVICSYSNPYRINKEQYWNTIKNSFHLCVSQTLVNGLCDQYSDFFAGKLTTITRFINHLYSDWESDITEINQRAIIDNLVDYIDFADIVGDALDLDDLKLSLKRNRGYILKSVRVMFELGMNPNNIKESALSYEQKCVVAIYKELYNTKNKYFFLKENFSQEEIDEAIIETMQDAINEEDSSERLSGVNMNVIVIHGIHQFSPIMLKAIEILSKYKTVFVLFNYIPEYKNVYQTWLNVYSWFENKTLISSQNFYDRSPESMGAQIANNVAALIAGSTATIDYSNLIEVIEFDNQTEFAGYIAQKFEKAELERAQDNYAHSTLFYMDEQIYSANSNVNDLLKIYFPEQFGERNFMDYPIGHFFLSIMNMWNEETSEMEIKDLNDVYECLASGIITERTPGQGVSTFEKCKLFFANEKTITDIIKKLKRLKRRINTVEEDSTEFDEISRIEYFDVSGNEIDDLIESLTDLNNVAKSFFEDFNDKKNDFKKFYKKISDVLITKILDKKDIDSDFRDIVVRVLQRLKEVEGIEQNASFDCLKESMQLYLQQLPKEGKGARWIVRNFEQIDGDVLRRTTKKKEKIYHFACLSDQDMGITHREEFPWPLDIDFFEVAQAPVDWKYQVYVTSRLEYKNFRRYALVYGLSFSRCRIILSYIKNGADQENELYYLLKILNAKPKPYYPEGPNSYRKQDDYIKIQNASYKKFSQFDLMKYRLCKYRFLLETLVEGNSIYKDEFLLRLYLATILEHRIRKQFSGKPYVKNIVRNYLLEQMDELAADFPFVNQSEKVDIINMAENYIEKVAVTRGKFVSISSNEIDYMIKRENFLSLPSGKNADKSLVEVLKNATQAEIQDMLNDQKLDQEKYHKSHNKLCAYCADKDICLEVFRIARQ